MTIDRWVDQYHFLSNFSPHPVGAFPTAEHAFQAHKATTEKDHVRILRAPTPAAAKRIGRGIALRPNWDAIKLAVMYGVLRDKFSDPELRRMLLETGVEELIEVNTWGDRYWGVDGTGENWLGRLLMLVRSQLAMGEQMTGLGWRG